MKDFAVFVSGSGTNLQAIIDKVKSGYIKANLNLVISDNPNAYALKRAENAGIETAVFDFKDFDSKRNFENAILNKLEERNIDFIVLAGFMRVLSPDFVKQYSNKILNIHPALLPSFKGVHGIKDAYEYGVKITGPTVHFVTEDVDSGPIIIQKAIEVRENDTLESLEEKIHKVEHQIFPEAIKLFTEGRLSVEGQKIIIS